LENRLGSMEQAARKMNGQHNVSFNEIFSDSFMQQHNVSNSISKFLKKVNITDNTSFEACPDKDLENLVKAKTDFSSWEEMQTEAAKDYTIKKLGF